MVHRDLRSRWSVVRQICAIKSWASDRRWSIHNEPRRACEEMHRFIASVGSPSVHYDESTCRQVSRQKCNLNRDLRHMFDQWSDRLCVHAIDASRSYPTRHTLPRHLQFTISWEHSPTRKKSAEKARIKKRSHLSLCVIAPINLPGPTNPWAHHLPACRSSCHVAPPSVPLDSCDLATRPRHIRATQAPVWAHVALPRGLACHVASARVPRNKMSSFCLFFKDLKWK